MDSSGNPLTEYFNRRARDLRASFAQSIWGSGPGRSARKRWVTGALGGLDSAKCIDFWPRRLRDIKG